MGKSGIKVWRNARLATFGADQGGIGTVEKGCIAVHDGRILYAGPQSDLPGNFAGGEQIDCEERWITPGLIDCHTHLAYAGNRSREFEMRLNGATYQEISNSGGGIVSSMHALRASDEDELLKASIHRLRSLMAEGVTTVEIKSGYGLDLENELKTLRVARRLGAANVNVQTTLLAAHALPPEAENKLAYIDLIVNEILPAAVNEGLVDAVDAFCEGIAFSPEEISLVFDAARRSGLPVKLHADQMTDLNGAALAASYNALSADHLEYTNAASIDAMAQAGTVAVVLPGAYYFLREQKKPPVAELRRAGVPMAIATDCNPGTSPLTSILLAANMAAILFGLTVEECLLGITRHAARALGMADKVGSLEAGKWADFAIWSISDPAELVYWLGFNPLHSRVWHGTPDI